ncbi:rod shape-determining protein RodA [Novilysobacter avium]|uniref:Peptidoglycan glycosyltransferase MrdB n=1 Tax=Novilysobacter avium TaxID=2781023 RepID=A0A7S6UKG6_9GAMM|nr:rod shape-determining protein RodA [Lysobacter avium]QOW21870.1 rod shape-determining protein RodA [Lysobacter avium]
MRTILRWLLDMAARFTRTLDLLLLAALLALMGIGLAVLYSAGGKSEALVMAQASRFVIGLGVMWLLSRVSPLQLRNWTPLAYAATIVPLLIVLFIGQGRHGGHWINLGVFYFQPAEVLKLSLPMMVAWQLNRAPLPPSFRATVVAMVLIALPTGLVLLQPDLGTALLVGISGAFVLYLAGLSWWWFVAAAGSIAVAAPAAWFWMFRPYQKDRILMFLDPERDPLGAGWNIIQSKIAIGGGGLTGKGWGDGSQSHLNYIPEHTTDFIFAVLSEEFGWIGVAITLGLYLFVVGRCLWVSAQARDGYSRLLTGALGLAFFVYVVVNGGMVAGMLPVVGVPMPLLSYGGTSAVSLLAGMGVVMAVRAHRPVHGH